MDKEKALLIWKQLFQDQEIAYDFASHPMKREEFNNPNSPYGWNIDLKKPFLNVTTNMICCALTTIRLRGSKNSFKIGQNTFEVRRGKAYGTFSIYDITDRNHPINMDPTPENQDPEYNKNRLHSIATVEYNSNKFDMVSPDQIRKNVFQENLKQEVEKEELPKKVENPFYVEDTDTVSHVVLSRNEALEETYVVPEMTKVEEETSEKEKEVEKPNYLDDGFFYELDEDEKEEEVVEEEKEIEEVSDEESHEEVQEFADGIPQQQISEEQLHKAEQEQQLEEALEALEPVEVEEVNEEAKEVEEVDEDEPIVIEREKEVFGDDEEKRIEVLHENGIPQPEVHDNEVKKGEEEEEDSLSEEEKKHRAEVLQLTKLVEMLKTQIKTDTENLINLNKLLDEKSAENDKLQQELAEKEQNIAQNQSINEEKENEQIQNMLLANEALKRQILELNERIQKLEEEKKQKDERIETLISERDTAVSESEIIKENNLSLSEQVNQLEESSSKEEELQKELAEKEHEIDSLNQRIAELEQDNSDRQEQYETVHTENNERLEQLQKENDALNEEINNLNEANAKLQEDKERIQQAYDSLDAQSQFTDEQKAVMDTEYEQLYKQEQKIRDDYQDLQIKFYNLTLLHDGELRERDRTIDELNHEVEDRENQLNDYKETINNLTTQKQVANEEKDRIEALNKANVSKITDLYNENNEKDITISRLEKEVEDCKEDKERATINLKVEKDYFAWYAHYLELNGDPEHYDDLIHYIEEQGYQISNETIEDAITIHRNWLRKESTLVEFNPYVADPDVISDEPTTVLIGDEDVSNINKERERRIKALAYYAELIGEDKAEVSDFAGRYLRPEEYGKKDSPFGWDYVLLNDRDIDCADNVLIANYRSLKDFRPNEKFESNGHLFQVEKEGDKYIIASKDFIADPYNFDQALEVTRDNRFKTSPLLYIYVKAIGITSAKAEAASLMEFFDLVDRTVKRCCPKSFVEMKTNAGTSDSIFLTFDGSVDGSYKEVLDYAVLLNSYRRTFKEKGMINAIIILNQVDVPFSKRHLDYENLLKESKDVELKAIRYELNLAVINSTIKRSIHIGPTILDNLPIDQSILKPSSIGKGDFSKMFSFNGEFKVCNFIFNLKRKADEDNE